MEPGPCLRSDIRLGDQPEEVIAQTISDATPEAAAEALAVIQKITKVSGVVDPKIPVSARRSARRTTAQDQLGRRRCAVPEQQQLPENFFKTNSPRGAVNEAEGGGRLLVTSKNFPARRSPPSCAASGPSWSPSTPPSHPGANSVEADGLDEPPSNAPVCTTPG